MNDRNLHEFSSTAIVDEQQRDVWRKGEHATDQMTTVMTIFNKFYRMKNVFSFWIRKQMQRTFIRHSVND